MTGSTMTKYELVRLIEAERTARGYEYRLRNEKYLSCINAAVLAEYGAIATDIMQHITELVDGGTVTYEDIMSLRRQIDADHPEGSEQEKILFMVMRARNQGIIDDYFERCIQRLTVLKGWPVDSVTHSLIERPAVMSYIVAVMDRYADMYKQKDEDYIYGVCAYWLIRQLISGDPRTTRDVNVPETS